MEWQGFIILTNVCLWVVLVHVRPLEWVGHKHLKIDSIIYLLDDFLIVAPSFQLRKSQLSNFISFCYVFGFPIAPDKTCGPGTVLFAGIELDSNLREARLLREKIEKFLAATPLLSKRKKVVVRHLSSIVRLLNFACSVVTTGRPLLRRLIGLTTGVRSP